MPTAEELQKDHEARLDGVLAGLRGRGAESDAALIRALVHRAVHLAAETKAVEFCGVATLMAEMTMHAHQLLHGSEGPGPAHRDAVH